MTEKALGDTGENTGTGEKTVRGEFVCVVCPNGCFIEAEYTDGSPPALLSLTGNACGRGRDWVIQELENPMRTIATSVSVRGGDFLLASVRTTTPIPLSKVEPVMRILRTMTFDAPLSIGQIVLKNPSGTNTEIIVTRTVRVAAP